ncbi:Serine/arginine-rich splicing factor 7 [Ophiophagus hannah]|uniref:Serine/arginine-rich splicing factor 7 n=1 Tax=Ophiophagus hannah TaxID=8665 RepID=V8NYM4_OPHHA|nr:Serine/arginine-rich splicing factor 7 [Ophiophagus hannah]
MSRYSRYAGETKVYVGNLGTGAGKGELERAFSYYGPLRTVWIARNPPGFAFVEFEDPRDAEDAVRGLDGKSRSRSHSRSRGRRYSRSRSRSRGRRSRSISARRSRSLSPRRSRSISPRRSRSGSLKRSSVLNYTIPQIAYNESELPGLDQDPGRGRGPFHGPEAVVRHQEALEEVSVLKEWIRMAKNVLGKVLFT